MSAYTSSARATPEDFIAALARSGDQIPEIRLQPELCNDEMWVIPVFPGVVFAGPSAWKRLVCAHAAVNYLIRKRCNL